MLTPLRTADARTILINRGFMASRTAPAPPPGRVTVTGLLRISEPGGGFLRSNDAAADRWYSRDVAAIARRRGVVALPYFIDRDATGNRAGDPVGGLTVIAFPDNHLVYAITWFTLAAMAAAGFVYSRRLETARVRR